MAGQSDVVALIAVEHGCDFAQDGVLRIDRPFPSVSAFMRFGEEPVRDRFELGRRQEAGRGPVILVHPLPDLDRKAKMACQDFGRFHCLALARRHDAPD